jgi:hypothetical protein
MRVSDIAIDERDVCLEVPSMPAGEVVEDRNLMTVPD